MVSEKLMGEVKRDLDEEGLANAADRLSHEEPHVYAAICDWAKGARAGLARQEYDPVRAQHVYDSVVWAAVTVAAALRRAAGNDQAGQSGGTANV